MGFKTHRPIVFRRDDETEENYLVLMHYAAMVLWGKGLELEALDALRTLLCKVAEQMNGSQEPRRNDPTPREKTDA